MRQNISSRLLRANSGQSLIETAITLTLLVLLLAAAVDFGTAFYKDIEVKGAARAGASYGETSPSDSTGITNAAKGAAGNIASDTHFSVNSSWGCECYDSSSPSVSCASAPSCSPNLVDYVTVTVSDTYTPLFPWPGVPSTMSMSSTVTMRAGQ